MNNHTFSLQKQILDQLHSSHMGIEKTCLFARESVHWINMNVTVEHVVKQCATCLECLWTQPSGNALHYEIPCRPAEVVCADVYMIYGKTLLCIVDYHRKISNSEKNKQHISRWSSADNLGDFCRMWASKENCFRWGCLKIFAGRWTFSKQLHHHNTTKTIFRWKLV